MAEDGADPHDVVIVGGGLAGLVAGNRALQLGLKPIILEAGGTPDYLCNSRMCGGVFHVAFHTIGHRPEVLAKAIEERIYGVTDPDLGRLMASNANRVVPWLQQEGVSFVRGGHEQYLFYVLAPPKWNKPGFHWRGRGGDVMLRTLTRNLLHRGGKLQLGTRATGLIMEDGRCVGVEAESRSRKESLRTQAVILADGGYQADPELLKHVSPRPERVFQRNARTGKGQGIRLAEEVGAEIVGLGWFYGHLLSRDAFGRDELWPYPVLDHLAAAGVIVDGNADRFCDEGLGGIFISNAVARLDDPLSAIAVFDDRIWHGKPGTYHVAPPNPHLEREQGTLHRSGTLTGLAYACGLEPARLEATVAAYNAALDTGRLGQLHPARSQTRAKAMPISTPPYYAAPACAGLTYTMGGIHVDAGCRALRKVGGAIEGLWVAGSSTGGFEGGEGAGYMGGLAKASVTGLVAAESIAAALGHAATSADA
ncbi:MAG: FAD-binding protein [Hyphomicrobiaceae bacterium]